jgi:hypothetical protein
MARISRPWYCAQKSCYKAYVKGRRVTLLTGAESPENEKPAAQKLRQILKGSKNDGPAHLRVADVIDRYLALHKPMDQGSGRRRRLHEGLLCCVCR